MKSKYLITWKDEHPLLTLLMPTTDYKINDVNTFPLRSPAPSDCPARSSPLAPSLRLSDRGLAVGDVDVLPMPFDINGGGPRRVPVLSTE